MYLLALPLAAMAADLPARAPRRVYECPAPAGVQVAEAALSPDGRNVAQVVVTLNDNGQAVSETVRVLDFHLRCAPLSGGAAKKPESDVPPNTSQPFGLRFTPDGQNLLFSDGSALHVLRMNPLAEARTIEIAARDHPTRIAHLALASDAPVVAVLAQPERVPPPRNQPPRLLQRPEFEHLFRAYDVRTGEARGQLILPHDVLPVGLALSADGTRAAISVSYGDQAANAREPDLWIVDTSSGAVLNRFRVRTLGQVAFTRNGAVATLARGEGPEKRVIKIVDAQTGAVLHQIESQQEGALALLLPSDDDRYLLAPLHRSDEVFIGLVFDEFGVWDAASGQLAARIKTPPLANVRLSRGAGFLLSGSRMLELDLAPESNSGRP